MISSKAFKVRDRDPLLEKRLNMVSELRLS